MRLAILALAVLLAITACAAANPASVSDTAPIKNTAAETPPPPKSPMQGGDTIATAFVIGALPFDDTGTTVGYTHDYDEVCTYTGSLSPDVVYKYSPATNVMVDIYTCNSGYDTKIYVYDNVYTPGAPLACNDDSTICTGLSYRSYIQNLALLAGHTYYIVVDGYGSASGAYEFHVHAVVPPEPCDPLFCAAGAVVNGEPTCYDGYVDTYNNGCGSATPPNVFETIALNTTLCGESGNFDANGKRDMDWFHYTPTTNVSAKFCLCSDFPGRIWIATGNDCASLAVLQTIATTPGYLACITQAMTAGTMYTLIISTDGWLNIPCGAKYVALFGEEGYTPVLQTSWGTVKALYR